MPSSKVKPSASRSLTVWEAKMATAAEKSAKAERPVSMLSGISTRGGVLTVDERPVPGNELDVVVLVAVHENQKFDGPYNPDSHQIPSCYSFGDPDAEDPEGSMAPHEEASDKQGDDNGLCAGCWANAMGSDPTPGRKGKACKNVRRLALITADCVSSADDIASAEVRVLKVPVMSVKGWATYVRQDLKELGRPYWGVVTTVKVVPDAKSQFKILFTFKELVDFTDETFDALEKLIEKVKPQLTTPYVQMEAPAPAPAPRGRAPARQPPAAPMKPVGRAAQAMAKAAPMKPVGRAAQAMAKAAGGKPAAPPAKAAPAPAKKAKY